MRHECIDTNVIVRFLVETPETIPAKFGGVFGFFAKLEQGTARTHLPDLVLFQAYFVLTSYYGVPRAEAAEKLADIVRLRGIHMVEKDIVVECMGILQRQSLDIVDVYLVAYSKAKGLSGVYSFDSDISEAGLRLLKVG
jgi:predicted nucleic acid-binding protein